MFFSRDYVLWDQPPAKYAPGFTKRNSATTLRQTPTGHVRTEVFWDNNPELTSAYQIAQDLSLSATFALCIVYVQVSASGTSREVCSQVTLSGCFQNAQDAAKWEGLRDQLEVQERLSAP